MPVHIPTPAEVKKKSLNSLRDHLGREPRKWARKMRERSPERNAVRREMQLFVRDLISRDLAIPTSEFNKIADQIINREDFSTKSIAEDLLDAVRRSNGLKGAAARESAIIICRKVIKRARLLGEEVNLNKAKAGIKPGEKTLHDIAVHDFNTAIGHYLGFFELIEDELKSKP